MSRPEKEGEGTRNQAVLTSGKRIGKKGNKPMRGPPEEKHVAGHAFKKSQPGKRNLWGKLFEDIHRHQVQNR